MATHDSKQLEILQYIYDTVENRGFPPTVREICAAVGLSSTSTVHGHLTRLERKGYLIKDATKPRALEITHAGLDALGIKPKDIPVIGVCPPRPADPGCPGRGRLLPASTEPGQ